ncbi:N-acetylmuramoyl-L-alanine amidase [Maledivibacter halophilus]|uniref:N-acetylmuramoyl-L-alanine amidase n=1 Tax=Maledivibacter halophilus TaxID=36842 RepID=A0A1T5KGS0_9FIRM|nr:N-acetylmuramoyl-L-alanine amidase [Maledivibacter halophilus]
MAYSDRELLARIIKCESGGEGDNGLQFIYMM